jgi:hypothetical protein
MRIFDEKTEVGIYILKIFLELLEAKAPIYIIQLCM